jgi:hypothetical protein
MVAITDVGSAPPAKGFGCNLDCVGVLTMY